MLQKKICNLKQRLRELKRVAVAFSGGVDSTFLLKMCLDVLKKEDVLAVTARTDAITEKEFIESKKLAKMLNVKHIAVEADITSFLDNTPQRCYFCKRELFIKFLDVAKRQGYNYVIEGSNFSDSDDFRPGMVALKELGIISPLKEVGLTKDEIRKSSRDMGLCTWDKPSYACLLSRFPYGEKITREKLKRVAEGERILSEFGFYQFRVRSHGNLARIEVLPEEMDRFFDKSFRHNVATAFEEIGFTYITLDLKGYRTGSMNEQLREEEKAIWKN